MQVSVGIIGEKSFFGEDDALFQRSRKFSATARYTHPWKSSQIADIITDNHDNLFLYD